MAGGIAIGIGGGTGGGALQAPESLVYGPSQYIVPAGKLAVIKANQGSLPLLVDGNKLLDMAGPSVVMPAGGATGSHVSSPTLFQNFFSDRIELSGQLQLQGTDGFGFQGGTIKMNSTVIAAVPYAGSYVYYFQGIEIPYQGRLWIDTLVTYLNPPSSTNFLRFRTGTQIDGDTNIELGAMIRQGMHSESNLTISLPEGSTIEGGDFIAEIYSV